MALCALVQRVATISYDRCL